MNVSKKLLAVSLGSIFCILPQFETMAKTPMDVALNQIVTMDNAVGALYIDRDRSHLNIWRLNVEQNEITYLDKMQIDPANVTTISIDDNVTAIYYSDNLWDDFTYSLSLTGTGEKVAVVMPLNADKFESLYEHSELGKTSPISSPNNQALAIEQQQISHLSNDFHQTHLSQIDDFKQLVKEEVYQSYLMSISHGEQMKNWQENGTGFMRQLEQQLLNQVNSDWNTLSRFMTNIAKERDSAVGEDYSEAMQCAESTKENIRSLSQQITTELNGAKEGEDEARYEEMILSYESKGHEYQTQLTQCVSVFERFENYDPSAIGNIEKFYNALAASAEQFTMQNEREQIQLAEKIAMDGDEMQERILNTPIVAQYEQYQQYQEKLRPWISKKFYQQSLEDNTQPINKKALDPFVKSSELSALHNKALKDEKLCEKDGFFLEVNLGFATLVLGTPWDDFIKTGNDNNLIFSFSGDDCIESHGGYDLVVAGPGRDTVYAGDDHDIVLAGRDDDEVHGSAGNSYTFTIGTVTMNVDIGNLILGQAGNDKLYGGEVNKDRGENGSIEVDGFTDIILGDGLNFGAAPGKDTIHGEKGMNFIFGMKENDYLQTLDPGKLTINAIDIPVGSYFFGGANDDVIVGSNTTFLGFLSTLGDFVFGNDGNDTVTANKGWDFVFGGLGNDNLSGNNGPDFIFGARGQDRINGNNGSDFLFGGPDNDLINAGAGIIDFSFGNANDDNINGQDGFDIIFGATGNDRVNGGNFFDLIFGGTGQDILNGDNDPDLIFGGDQSDIINGGAGIDLLFGNQDSDTIHGNDGIDVIFGNSNSEQIIERLFGDNGTDIMFGNSGNDWMSGGNSIDFMLGNSGDDDMQGDNDADLLMGNEGNDTIDGNAGLDFLLGNRGNDQINGGTQTDLVLGGQGCDDINGGDAADVLLGGDDRDEILGGNGSDLMIGGAAMDMLFGQNGIDIGLGGDGNDFINGGAQSDVVHGGEGNDHLLGEANSDVMLGGDGNDYMHLGNDNDIGFGGQGADTIDGGTQTDFIFAGEGNDRIKGNFGTDFLFGNAGNDLMRGVEDRNFVFGNSGSDTLDGFDTSTPDTRDFLFGNSGNDNITGNKWNQRDIRVGGSGSDNKQWNTTFVNDALFNQTWTGNTNCN